jgi:broad specificity phosphatase PhoE
MNNIDYKSKYIKYKLKYLDLIKQHAGTDPIIVLLCSHQGRLACLIHAIIGKKLDKKFKNCCIIKLSKIGDNISLEIVYEGELVFDKCKDAPEICQKKIDDENKKYYNNSFQFELDEQAKKKIKYFFLDKNIIIYMVRHGDGEHLALKRKGFFAKFSKNIKDRFTSSDEQILRDARLTSEGITQAVRAGDALADLLGDTRIDSIFFSDLRRTRETIEAMLSSQKIDAAKIPNTAIVLPCSHEVDYKQDGRDCDGKGLFADMKRSYSIENLPGENKITKFPNELNIKPNNKKIIVIDNSSYANYYNPEEKVEDKKVSRNKSSVKKCRNETMFQLLADIVFPDIKKLRELPTPKEIEEAVVRANIAQDNFFTNPKSSALQNQQEDTRREEIVI